MQGSHTEASKNGDHCHAGPVSTNVSDAGHCAVSRLNAPNKKLRCPWYAVGLKPVASASEHAGIPQNQLGRVDEFEVFLAKSVGYRKTNFSLNASKINRLLLIRQHALGSI